MPSEKEHSARINNPDKYAKIRRKNDKFGAGIHAIYGVLDSGKTEVQAIHFDKTKFTATEARKWLKDHDYKPIEFEPAKEKSDDVVLEYKNFKFNMAASEEIKSNGSNYGVIKGYASTFGNVDRGGDIVQRGAFVKTLERFRQEGKQIAMCFQHSMMDIIGGFEPSKMHEDEKGLYVEGNINLGVERGRDVYALAKQGVLCEMSIGFTLDDYELEPSEDGYINRKLKEINLWEISMVAVPMNPMARITDVKNSEIESVTIQDINNVLKKDHLDFGERKYLLEKLLHSGTISKTASKFIAEKFFSEEKEVKEDKKEEINNRQVDVKEELTSILNGLKESGRKNALSQTEKELSKLLADLKTAK